MNKLADAGGEDDGDLVCCFRAICHNTALLVLSSRSRLPQPISVHRGLMIMRHAPKLIYYYSHHSECGYLLPGTCDQPPKWGEGLKDRQRR